MGDHAAVVPIHIPWATVEAHTSIIEIMVPKHVAYPTRAASATRSSISPASAPSEVFATHAASARPAISRAAAPPVINFIMTFVNGFLAALYSYRRRRGGREEERTLACALKYGVAVPYGFDSAGGGAEPV